MRLGLGIDGSVLDQPLALDVVKDGLVGIDLDGLIGRGHLRAAVVLLEEDDGFIPQVERRIGGIGLGGSVIGRVRLRNLAGARIDFAQAGIGNADNRQARLLCGCLQIDRLLIRRDGIVVFLQPGLPVPKVGPQQSLVRLGPVSLVIRLSISVYLAVLISSPWQRCRPLKPSRPKPASRLQLRRRCLSCPG